MGDTVKTSPTGKRPPFMTRNYVNGIHEIQRSFTDILFGGVLERFPQLCWCPRKNDSGWFPHYLYRLDYAYENLTSCRTSRCR